MTSRWVAPYAARALIVSTVGSKVASWSAPASVQPPIRNTGAAPEESSPHHGTARTAARVGAPRPSAGGPWAPLPSAPSVRWGPGGVVTRHQPAAGDRYRDRA